MVQVVEESSTSVVFSIALAVVYDECIISEVTPGTMSCYPAAAALILLLLLIADAFIDQ